MEMLPNVTVLTVQVDRFGKVELGLNACVQNDGVHLMPPDEYTSLFVESETYLRIGFD